MTTIPKTTPEQLLARVRQGRRFLIASHQNPDGDAVGTGLGLARILRGLGKSAQVWSCDAVPGMFRTLPGAERLHLGAEPPKGFPDAFDTAIVLECPSLDRTGLAEHLAQLPVLNIDHHLGNQHYGQVNWIDTSAPAVGEMILRLARDQRATVDPEAATLLLLALTSDTGGFRFANSTAAAFEAAASLVRDGARPDQVSRWIYESHPPAAVRLLGEMLATLALHDGGRIASCVLTRAMFDRAGAGPGDSEGLIDHPRGIAGVEAVFLLRELAENRWKASLRSRGEVVVERIARHHGGGGHKNASGFTVDGRLSDLSAALVDELTATLDQPVG